MVLEAIFQVRRPGAGGDAMRPRFARHAAHVAAATGLPVFDIYSMITWFQAGLRPRVI